MRTYIAMDINQNVFSGHNLAPLRMHGTCKTCCSLIMQDSMTDVALPVTSYLVSIVNLCH